MYYYSTTTKCRDTKNALVQQAITSQIVCTQLLLFSFLKPYWSSPHLLFKKNPKNSGELDTYQRLAQKKEANLGFKDSLCEYQLDNDEMKEEEAYSRLHAVCMAGESEEGGPAPVLQLQSTNRLGCALATCKCKKLRRNFCDVMKAELCECVCILSYSMLLHDDVVNTMCTEK